MQRISRQATNVARVAALTFGAAFLAGCNLGSLDFFGGELDKISLDGPSVVQVGDTIRLTATGSVSGLAGLMFLDPLHDARFKVSDATVAAIIPWIPPAGDTVYSASVLVKGLKTGRVNVTVSARSKSDTHLVDVVAPSP